MCFLSHKKLPVRQMTRRNPEQATILVEYEKAVLFEAFKQNTTSIGGEHMKFRPIPFIRYFARWFVLLLGCSILLVGIWFTIGLSPEERCFETWATAIFCFIYTIFVFPYILHQVWEKYFKMDPRKWTPPNLGGPCKQTGKFGGRPW